MVMSSRSETNNAGGLGVDATLLAADASWSTVAQEHDVVIALSAAVPAQKLTKAT